MEIIVKETKTPDIYKFEIDGELDLYGYHEFKDSVKKHIEQGRKKAVFDLANMSYIDSSGVGCLVALFHEFKTAGGEMKFTGANPKVKEVFEFTHLDMLLKFFDSEEEAIKSILSPSSETGKKTYLSAEH